MEKAYTVEFNRIYVIESLRQGDPRTGRDLHADVLRWEDASGGPQAVYQRLESSDQLNEHLRFIHGDVLRGVVKPFIHLELHGNREGLELANNDFISWDELVQHFRAINLASKNNLIVSLAACSGAFIYRTISPLERAPFWGFVGPWNDVNTSDIVNYQHFFETLLTTRDVNKAIKRLNRSIPKERHFVFHNAEAVFEKLRSAYAADLHDPERRSVRVQSIMSYALSNIYVRHMFTLPELRNKIETMLLNLNDETWEERKRAFLGMDDASVRSSLL